jgi:hypothetical protein
MWVATPEFTPLLTSICWCLPMLFSLWLMTTPEDRSLLLHPSRFRSEMSTEMSTLMTSRSDSESKLKAERLRMGIELQ